MVRSIATIILCLVCFSACQNKSESSHFIRVIYPQEMGDRISYDASGKNLSGVEEFSDPTLKIPGDIDLLDKKLVIADLVGDTTICIYDLNKRQITQKLGVKGYGPGEIMAPFYVGTLSDREKDDFYVFDVKLRKITVFREGNKEPIQISTIGELYQPMSRDGSNFIAMSKIGKGRLAFFENSGPVEFKGLVPKLISQKVSTAERVSAHKGAASMSKDGDFIVVSSSLTDNIQVFDSEGKIKLELEGPDFLEPAYSGKLYSEDRFLLSETKQTKYAFPDVYAGHQHFFVLYSGISNEESFSSSNQGKFILCFDYSGTFVQKFNLDYKLLKFAVDEENKKIYGSHIDSENPGIIMFDYSGHGL